MNAFDALRVMTRTNSHYRDLRTAEMEYTGDFMGKTLVKDYLHGITTIWAQFQYIFPTDSISLLATVPIESD